MVHWKWRLTLATALFSLFMPAVTQAEPTTLDVIDRGFLNQAGDPSPNLNYQAGDPHNPAAIEHRNYFIFDMSAVSHEICSAELHLKNPSGSGNITGFLVLWRIWKPIQCLKLALTRQFYSTVWEGSHYSTTLEAGRFMETTLHL